MEEREIVATKVYGLVEVDVLNVNTIRESVIPNKISTNCKAFLTKKPYV